jgi:AraC-like DNA-binding protein
MARDHDSASEFAARESGSPGGAAHGRHVSAWGTKQTVVGDVLSDVLRAVRLTGAVFFVTEASAPWVMELPDGATLAPALLPGVQHVLSYHIVTHGSVWVNVPDETPIPLHAGDVVVFPHGDPYVMSLARGLRGGPAATEMLAFLREMAAGRLPFTVREGGRGPEFVHLVCGFLGCDARPFNPLLGALPPLLHVQRALGDGGDALGRLFDLTMTEANASRAGRESVLLRLSELLFIEVVRQHLSTMSDRETGWLAGLRDPMVGRALALLHEQPARAWSLAGLAAAVETSRSTLAERFTQFVGQPPMRYLTSWRMQVAARLLVESSAKVAAVALQVGYDSEAAFSRAFRKVVHMTPAAWRARRTGGSARA